VTSHFLAGAEMITFFNGTAHMLLSIRGVGEATSGLDYYLRAHGLPGKLRGIFFGENLIVFPSTLMLSVRQKSCWANCPGWNVLKKVSQCFGIVRSVDGYEVKIRVF